MKSKPENEFYVGYLPTAPKALGRLIRTRVLLILALALTLGVTLMLLQKHFNPGLFDYGRVHHYRAIVRLNPVPIAMAGVEQDSSGNLSYHYYLLVNQGKFGAADLFKGLSGQSVEFDATLIRRDQQEMLEVVPGSVQKMEQALDADLAEARTIGEYSFEGEIVDSKCYLGVMSPGNLKTHKACAIRCLSGGIPPVLLVRDQGDQVLYLILVGPHGETMNAHVLDKVAQPVRIQGEVRSQGSLLYLLCDPADIVVL